jgi:hypothetical protein
MECCWFGQDPARGGVSQGLEASVQRHEVSPRELAGPMARLAKGAKDFAVLVECNDAIVLPSTIQMCSAEDEQNVAGGVEL